MDNDKMKVNPKGEVIDMVSLLKKNIVNDKDDIVNFHRKIMSDKKERAKAYKFFDNNYKETEEERNIMEAMTRRRRRRR